jgi:hypothetical protein
MDRTAGLETGAGVLRRAGGGSSWPAVVASLGVGMALALVVARVSQPEMIFPKYLMAAVAPPAERAERLLDYSPLYLGLVRFLLPLGPFGILAFQGLLHGLIAALAAVACGRLAGRWAAWLGGLGTASYRPFLVYCGIHEPETMILACLAAAVVCGLLARQRLAAWAPAAAQPVPEVGRDESAARGAAAAEPAALIALTALSSAALAAAALGRPQFAALVPVWAFWLVAAAPRGRWRAAHGLVWPVALVAAALVLAPPVWTRARITGVPVIMNPGAVFYEGNGPGATGLTRFAPRAVIELERAHRESIDYGHVAYRRIAAVAARGVDGPEDHAAAGRPPTTARPSAPAPLLSPAARPGWAPTGPPVALAPAAANVYWTGLAWEAIAAHPGAAAARFGRKALMAVMPYEGHDLIVAERLDREIRRWLPWGFALPLLALPWIFLARRERLIELAGPLALALLAWATQIATYASARQRLPLALALWIILPVLLADLLRGGLRQSVRPAMAVLLGLCAALGLAAATARVAVLDQVGWDGLLGRAAASPGEQLVAVADGRAFRPRLRLAAGSLAAAIDLALRHRPADSLSLLTPLLGEGLDFTSDDRKVSVPEYWAALDLLALDQRRAAADAARAAVASRPEDAQLLALARRLALAPGELPTTGAWRPAGCDPVSARLALAAAAAADRDRAGFLAALLPLAADLPELLPGKSPGRPTPVPAALLGRSPSPGGG